MFLVKCLLLNALFLSSRKQYESFTLKHHRHYHQVLQRWDSANRLIVRTSLIKHTLPLPHPKTCKIYLTVSPLARDVIYLTSPLPSRLARDVIYGWPHIRTWDVELNLTKNLNYFFFQVFVTYGIPVISKLFLLPYCSKWFPLISYDMTLFSRLFTFMRKR